MKTHTYANDADIAAATAKLLVQTYMYILAEWLHERAKKVKETKIRATVHVATRRPASKAPASDRARVERNSCSAQTSP